MSSIRKYRKKPVVVEALRFWGDVESLEAANAFTGQEFDDRETVQILLYEEYPIKTLEGTMTASLGDYIIKGVKGEFYPCKPDIFKQTYEEVPDEQ